MQRLQPFSCNEISLHGDRWPGPAATNRRGVLASRNSCHTRRFFQTDGRPRCINLTLIKLKNYTLAPEAAFAASGRGPTVIGPGWYRGWLICDLSTSSL